MFVYMFLNTQTFQQMGSQTITKIFLLCSLLGFYISLLKLNRRKIMSKIIREILKYFMCTCFKKIVNSSINTCQSPHVLNLSGFLNVIPLSLLKSFILLPLVSSTQLHISEIKIYFFPLDLSSSLQLPKLFLQFTKILTFQTFLSFVQSKHSPECFSDNFIVCLFLPGEQFPNV